MWMHLLGLALAATPPDVEAARAQVDWDAVGDTAAGWLVDYLAIDTIAPPGNEADGARFLQRLARSIGMTTQLIDHGDNRASLIARLPGTTDASPVCLMSHIDVVPFEEKRWKHAPRGELSDGIVWGRGAIDMKGMAVAQLAALSELTRLGTTFEREVILIAVAGEEVDSLGARTLTAEHWGALNCGVVLNEGGIGLKDAFFEGETVQAISVAEKGVLWARMIASGHPGHGSTPTADESPRHLLEAMERVARAYKPKPVMNPIHVEMLSRIGAHHGGFVGGIMRSGVGRKLVVQPKLMKKDTQRALLTNTVHLTGMGGAGSTNVVPSESWAQYDCRLLPGVEPAAFLQVLRDLTGDLPAIRWEVVLEMTSNGSPWDDDFFRTLAHYASEGDATSVSVPILSPGFTDSIHLRAKGARAYGYLPFVVDAAGLASMHGDDEHVSVANLARGARVIFSLLHDVAGAPPTAEMQEVLSALGSIPIGTDVPSIVAELEQRHALDQSMRSDPVVFTDPAMLQRFMLVDRVNRERLKAIVATHGWPTVPVFGKQASSTAWLLAQHADLDPAFQAEVIELLEPLLETGEVTRKNYAYLYDRVARAEGRVQRFGTQGRCLDTGGWQEWETEDPEGLDARRAEWGIQWTQAEYRSQIDCDGSRAKARAAYEAKQWSTCRTAYEALGDKAAGRAAGVHYYNAACCATLDGDVDAGFALLKQALQAGQVFQTNDPDLAALRADPRWKAIEPK